MKAGSQTKRAPDSIDRVAMLARAIAGTAAVAAALAGVVWGTHVAGGPDSYCYLSQAELFASGQPGWPAQIEP